jgi:hypothetical protein
MNVSSSSPAVTAAFLCCGMTNPSSSAGPKATADGGGGGEAEADAVEYPGRGAAVGASTAAACPPLGASANLLFLRRGSSAASVLAAVAVAEPGTDGAVVAPVPGERGRLAACMFELRLRDTMPTGLRTNPQQTATEQRQRMWTSQTQKSGANKAPNRGVPGHRVGPKQNGPVYPTTPAKRLLPVCSLSCVGLGFSRACSILCCGCATD